MKLFVSVNHILVYEGRSLKSIAVKEKPRHITHHILMQYLDGDLKKCAFCLASNGKRKVHWYRRRKKNDPLIRLPKSGMASETWGSVSATKLRNTVNESKMVTPEKGKREKGMEKE